MTGNRILLDTNVVIEVFKSNDTIITRIEKYAHSISTIILGELQVGVHRVVNRVKHEMLLNDFLSMSSIISVDNITAAIYGEISSVLFKKGKPIPTNDIRIAASAMQYNLTLFTKDKHFKEVDGIDIEFL